MLLGAALPLTGCGGSKEIAGGFGPNAQERGHLLRTKREWPAPSAVHRTRVLIAGGGVAGLAAARALRQRGIEDFALLELEDSAGGNSRGTQLDGIACPLGAHYLPVPGEHAVEVQDLLEELGLRRRVAGRWHYDERHLCHSPQERLFFRGSWQEGLLPVQDVSAATLEQYRRFEQLVAAARSAASFPIPVSKVPPARMQQALAAITFIAWLDRNGLTDMHLRWYLDYCCRDDYGAGMATVSAWAGLHYFASRHGFQAPGGHEAEPSQVLTWPQGNGWLTRRLAQPLGDRVRAARVVVRIAQLRQGVEIDALNAGTGAVERWQAAHCIVALPVFVAARVVESPPAALTRAAARTRYAPWVVANFHLREPLQDRPGAPPAWDNVVYGGKGLGYVDARHQALSPAPAATVLTWYCAPGEAARRAVLERPWQAWRDDALAELSAPHPDLRANATRVEVMRYGHAMAIPVPGDGLHAAPGGLAAGRLSFAHSDWAGYSIFEEAFTLGHLAGLRAG
jgi:monoamine oxidase